MPFGTHPLRRYIDSGIIVGIVGGNVVVGNIVSIMGTSSSMNSNDKNGKSKNNDKKDGNNGSLGRLVG